MRLSRALLLSSLALASSGIACKSAPKPFPDETEVAPAPVSVRFAPPESTPIVERSVQTRTERASGGAASSESVTATLESTFQKSGEGWLLTQRVPSVSISQNGTKVESDLAQLVTKFPVTVRLAKDGSFVELTNGEEIEKSLREAIPDPRQAEMVLAAFTPEAIEQETKSEWASRYGELLGRDVNVGMTWYGVETLGTSRGVLAYVVEHKLQSLRMTERGREAVIGFSCPVSSEQAGNATAMQQALERAGNPELEPSVTCAGTQVIALEPFSPESTEFDVRASPKEDSGTPVEISFTRSVNTEQAEPAQGAAKQP